MLRYTTRRFCKAASAAAANATAPVPTAANDEEPLHFSRSPGAPTPHFVDETEKAQIRKHLADYGCESSGVVLGDDGLPPMPERTSPYTPPPAFPHRPRRGISTPEYYNSRMAIGHPDELALELTAGRSDPEWQWLKFFCFICVLSTMGSWVYGVFFPEHMKWFKDEPWSTFRN